ncbi:MAG: hypothetical protein OEM15_06015 [Myxococcales bacterium]|nr:hypothetical protein [Myxococcales bacterium]MDH3483730.1 hypothetical protein [Myxococcales bacterium]
MRILWFIALCSALVFGCGESTGGDAAQSTPIEVSEASFDCILEGTKVRKFYVKNLIGDLEGSLAVANGGADLPYPPGTLLQLVPQEAMVKREAGFSPVTGDWEFFFLEISSNGTTIAQRGKDEAENAFGGNCFACHALAADNDFVCETDNGCDPLSVNDVVIEALQNGDARCE